MEDSRIVDLYWRRSENAITETKQKYGKMLYGISHSLTPSAEDAEECVSDTYLAAWNSMPSQRPTYLGAFLAKIVRRISVDRFRLGVTAKRKASVTPIDELEECLPDSYDVQAELENGALKEVLNRFLSSLPSETRILFVKRYFYGKELKDVAKETGLSEAAAKSLLFRTRQKLKTVLEREDLL